MQDEMAEARSELVMARDIINSATEGEDTTSLPTASSLIDRALQAMCRHEPTTWNSRSDTDGRIITTCEKCGVSWHQHDVS